MKKTVMILVAGMLLCGCAARQTMETVADEAVIPVIAQPKQIALDLPGESSVCTVENESGRLYLTDQYEIALQTLSAGDLDATVRSLTGFSKQELTVIQTRQNDIRRYDFVWTAAGEHGQRIGRGIILDDGNYHYCLTTLKDLEGMEHCQIVWDQIYQSFALV